MVNLTLFPVTLGSFKLVEAYGSKIPDFSLIILCSRGFILLECSKLIVSGEFDSQFFSRRMPNVLCDLVKLLVSSASQSDICDTNRGWCHLEVFSSLDSIFGIL